MSKKSDKEIHDKLVNLVDSIIAVNKKLNIDKIVYGLYGLTEDEIKVVENS